MCHSNACLSTVWGWSVWSWPVWSRCWSVDWGRGINWGWGICWGWSWGISWGWGSSIDGLSRVLDISNITIAISSVGNSLKATIGKVNMVFTIGVVSVTSLRGSQLNSAVLVRHSIVVVVCWDSVWVSRLSTISWSWGVGWCRSIDWGWSVCWNWGILS